MEKYEVEQLLMEELKDNIESCLGVNASNMNQLFVLLNLIQFNRAPGWGKTRGMIICHGSATASSIAEIVNKVLGFRIFEAIDMPINVSPTEIIQRLKKYMKYIKKPRELVILVDMGSLEEMYSCLSDVKGLKAIIINNVSTRMAMDAGAKIRSSISLDKIAETVCCENRSTYRLVDNTIPQKAILFCSETGIGAAKRMSEMFAASFPKKLNIEFLSVDYKNVLEPKSLQIILDKYEVCNGVQREHNKKLNNGLPILHKVPPKRDYGRYFCIMAEKGGTSHGGLTEKLSLFFHAKKQEVNAYGR